MKKIFTLIAITVLLTSCATRNISDGIIIVHEKHTIRKNYYYKFFYDCYQDGIKLRIYSNSDYKPGQPILIR